MTGWWRRVEDIRSRSGGDDYDYDGGWVGRDAVGGGSDDGSSLRGVWSKRQ